MFLLFKTTLKTIFIDLFLPSSLTTKNEFVNNYWLSAVYWPFLAINSNQSMTNRIRRKLHKRKKIVYDCFHLSYSISSKILLRKVPADPESNELFIENNFALQIQIISHYKFPKLLLARFVLISAFKTTHKKLFIVQQFKITTKPICYAPKR